ncbi:MAG: hypothetical protein HYZ21_07280 [Chloroflexi bacterium]|nr:hypothetical protein [Chloroflexota bacterium]
MNHQPNKRVIFMISGATDILLGGVVLLIYFGLLPFDISGWGILRWAIGVIGALLFFSGIAVFTYFLSKSDSSE